MSNIRLMRLLGAFSELIMQNIIKAKSSEFWMLIQLLLLSSYDASYCFITILSLGSIFLELSPDCLHEFEYCLITSIRK